MHYSKYVWEQCTVCHASVQKKSYLQEHDHLHVDNYRLYFHVAWHNGDLIKGVWSR